MTSPTSKPSTFQRAALASGLVDPAQIESAIAALRAEGGLDALPAITFADDRLAAQLVAQGTLTSYQAQQLKEGRTKFNLGPYLIQDGLGQGGMGQVFVGVHKMMDRVVAIKVLPRTKSTPDAIASFTREIQTQAKLDHRHLVRAYDAGHDGNVYFLVTEYVPGTDLRRLVRSQGRLTMTQAASIIAQAAVGLEYAHQQGLVHRDVKPGNILVTPEGLVKVSDLGLAGFLHEGSGDPRAGKIVGTADYLAPEKITNPHWISAVSDIYALGCTLYYAVTGKVPFPGGSTRDKARRHCEETPWHPRQFNPDVSDEFVDLIADMMEKDPERRIQTAGEVAQRLAPWSQQNPKLPAPHRSSSSLSIPIPAATRDETIDDFDGLEPLIRDAQENDRPPSTPRIAIPSSTTTGSRAMSVTEPHSSPPAVGANPLEGVPIGRRRTEGADRLAVRRAVFSALAIAIPLSLAMGSLLTWLLLTWTS